MSLEQALAANTAAIQALTAQLAGSSAPAVPQPPAQPSYPAPQQMAPPPVQQPMAPPPMAPPQMPQAPQQQAYPFHDSVSAGAWTTLAWNACVAANQDVAQAEFVALMGALGTTDFNQIGPDKFNTLYNGVQAIKAKMGIQG